MSAGMGRYLLQKQGQGGLRYLNPLRKLSDCVYRKALQEIPSENQWNFLLPGEDDGPIYIVPDNPCIPYVRQVIEIILNQRESDYRSFYPVILDFEEKEVHRRLWGMTEDAESEEGFAGSRENPVRKYEAELEILRLQRQMDDVLMQLVPNLNRMIIRTERAAYFTEFVQRMYEEYGLVIQLEEKSLTTFPTASFVIDFELWRKPAGRIFRNDTCYLPIYLRPWEINPNLDILVPIGYNTVIVKGVVLSAPTEYQDRFEREFYAG